MSFEVSSLVSDQFFTTGHERLKIARFLRVKIVQKFIFEPNSDPLYTGCLVNGQI